MPEEVLFKSESSQTRAEIASYLRSVADKLDEEGLAYDSIWVEGLHSQRDEVRRVSGQRAVPVIVDEDRGVTMAESDRILEFVERSYA